MAKHLGFSKEVLLTATRFPPESSRTSRKHPSETPSACLASPCGIVLTSLGIMDYTEGPMLLLPFINWHSTWLGVREHTHG